MQVNVLDMVELRAWGPWSASPGIAALVPTPKPLGKTGRLEAAVCIKCGLLEYGLVRPYRFVATVQQGLCPDGGVIRLR